MVEFSQKTLVTGVAGFLGSHLLDKLLTSEHQVVDSNNLLTGKLENIAGLSRIIEWYHSLNLYKN